MHNIPKTWHATSHSVQVARVLTDLAHGRDPHLAARQHETLNRLTRAHHKEPKP